jgi:hypothetical protein
LFTFLKTGDDDAEDADTPLIIIDMDYKAETASDCDVFAENAGELDKKSKGDFLCSCKFGNGQPCSQLWSHAHLVDLRVHHQHLQRDELDLLILSHIQAGLHVGNTTQCSRRKHQADRAKVKMDYYFQPHKICRDTFMYIYGVHKERLTNLIKHCKDLVCPTPPAQPALLPVPVRAESSITGAQPKRKAGRPSKKPRGLAARKK